MPAAPLPMPRLGMDLLSEDARIPAGCVRYAVNVDIDRDGQASARGGFVNRVSQSGLIGVGCFAGRCWLQRGRDVFWLDTQTWAKSQWLDAGAAAPIATTEINGDLWVAAASGIWRVARGSWEVSGPPVLPALLPRVTATGAGGLDEGVYGVAVSMIDPSGTESAAAWLGPVRTGAGLRLSSLETRMGWKWQVYLTSTNGDVLYGAERFDALLPQMAIGTPARGKECETLGLSPLPGGHDICAKGARVYVARGDALVFSRPFRPWLHHAAHDFVRFVGRIRFVRALDTGLFVGDDRGVWWLGGDDPQDARLTLATPSRAVAASALVLPAREAGQLAQGQVSPCVVWLGEDGYQMGLADGTARALQPGRLALDASGRGQSVHVRRNGRSQVVTLTDEYDARALRRPLGLALDLV